MHSHSMVFHLDLGSKVSRAAIEMHSHSMILHLNLGESSKERFAFSILVVPRFVFWGQYGFLNSARH